VRRFAALAALAVPLCACQATVQVAVAPKANGSGELSVSLVLDKDAATMVGDVGTGIKTDDLVRAGWTIDKPIVASDGGARLSAHHPFRTVGEADGLLAGLAGVGANVPFHLTLTHASGTLSSQVRLAGDVDLTGGVDRFADDKLRQALGAPTLAAALDRAKASGAAVPALSAEVDAVLPGRPAHVDGGTVSGDTVRWDVPLGARRTIGASASVADPLALAWLLGAAGFLAALVVVIVVRLRRRRQWRFGDRHSPLPRDFRGPGGGRNRGHQDRWSMPLGPGSRR